MAWTASKAAGVWARTLLKESYRPENLPTVMCRSLLSVDWQGYLYDCDFNQMLGMPAAVGAAPRPHLRDLLTTDALGTSIRVADHCYGCTAGQGSSCGGALEAENSNSPSLPQALGDAR